MNPAKPGAERCINIVWKMTSIGFIECKFRLTGGGIEQNVFLSIPQDSDLTPKRLPGIRQPFWYVHRAFLSEY
jgi:hypothetical protein